MRKIVSLLVLLSFGLAGCATTDIQPLTKTSFKVDTSAAPICGKSGARKVANQIAAIEVIKRGGDRYIIVADQTGSRLQGVSYNYSYNSGYGYGYGSPQYSNEQAFIVQMLRRGQRGSHNSLSARRTLGPDWKAIVEKGPPKTC